MVNFWAMDTVPERFRGRNLYKHNPNVTLMRTTAEECREIGEWIAEKLNACEGPVRFLIPENGVSAMDAPGQPFHDPEADAALFDALRINLEADRIAPADAPALPYQRSGSFPPPWCRTSGKSPHKNEGFETMPAMERKKILEKFRDMVARRVPIVGGGAGTGLSAKCEEAGGIDLIIIYNSGRYRMAGRGSAAGLLAYGNANEIVKEMAREVLPVVKKTPVLAGVNGTDPFVLMPQFLAELKGMGFSGVQNFPTIGLFDGVMRASFEETGMGYGLEVDMIRQAHELDLLTTPYVFNPEESKAMTEAGADIVVAHMGVTVGGSIGASSAKSLDTCVAEIDEIAEAALKIRKDVIVLCHGGPIASPENADYILKHARICHGFYGASSMERLPTEIALTEQTRKFKSIQF